MSGDVQPRKRKDKKKRKDEDVYGSNEDLTIHVHKDGGTGGNICAKIVFFFLFSALIVLVGLIIKENQGLNELDTIDSESRFSQIFEGWIDKSPDEHDDHSPEIYDHDEEEDEHMESEEEGNIEEDTEEEQSEELEENESEDEDSIARSEEDEEDETVEESNEEVIQSEEDDSVVDENDVEEQSDENKDEDTEELNESTEQDIAKESKEVDKSEEVKEESKEIQEVGQSEEKVKIVSAEQETTDIDQEEEPKEQEEIQKDGDEVVANQETEKKQQSSGNVNVGDDPESDSDREYEHSDITNKDDFLIREDIDAAQQQLDNNAAYANQMFEALLEKYPLSPRLLYGKARALDILAEKNQSNDLLQQSLHYYSRTLSVPKIPDKLFVLVCERYIDRARFMGQYRKAIAVHWQLIEKFPENATYQNILAVTYLTINVVKEARSILKKVLLQWPDDGFALVHYGFILKTSDNDLEGSVEYMTKGLKTKAPGVIDGRFYFHLGDALTRLNRKEEAERWYLEGVAQNVFMSKYQRSLYNVQRLTAKPWWQPEDIPSYSKLFLALKENWSKIRREGLSALNDQGYFRDEAENLKDTGTWKQLELFARGQKISRNCEKSPITCGIIRRFLDASKCSRGQSKFSVMHPGTHVWPHCGPTNCRLRIHLGLKVPPNTFIRVAEETRSWKEGDIIIFDDSFEHEVWHNGSEFRLVLIVDVWHPELTFLEKQSLSSI